MILCARARVYVCVGVRVCMRVCVCVEEDQRESFVISRFYRIIYSLAPPLVSAPALLLLLLLLLLSTPPLLLLLLVPFAVVSVALVVGNSATSRPQISCSSKKESSQSPKRKECEEE